MAFDEYFKETLKSAYAAELVALSTDDINNFVKLTKQIEALGISTFWAPDRIQDMTSQPTSPISLSLNSRLLHSASVRIATKLAMSEESPQILIDIAMAVYGYGIANVAGEDAKSTKDQSGVYLLDKSYRAYVRFADDSQMQSFLLNNYWLAAYFLFITTGSAAELFESIQSATNS